MRIFVFLYLPNTVYNHTFCVFANTVDTEWSHSVALIYISIRSETEHLFNCKS